MARSLKPGPGSGPVICSDTLRWVCNNFCMFGSVELELCHKGKYSEFGNAVVTIKYVNLQA